MKHETSFEVEEAVNSGLEFDMTVSSNVVSVLQKTIGGELEICVF